MSDYIDIKAVKSQLDFPAVLSHYNITHNASRDQDKIVCPFHDDHDPSCSINKSKGMFQCFPCGAKGNMLAFVALMENLDPEQVGDIKQAAEYAAENILGQSVDSFRKNKGATKNQAKPGSSKNRRPEGSEGKSKTSISAASCGRNNAKESKVEIPKVNDPMTFELQNLDREHSYFSDRKLNSETIETFGLGMCSKGMMNGRIVIPIHNKEGERVAYIGRWPDDETIPKGEGKYKAPKGFHKGLELYNQHRALTLTDDDNTLIVVEGFWSTMRLYNEGYATVATMSTQVSKDQIEAIAGFGNDVLIIFDGDDAGREGAKRLAAELAEETFVRILVLPEGIKPDTMDLNLIENAIDQVSE